MKLDFGTWAGHQPRGKSNDGMTVGNPVIVPGGHGQRTEADEDLLH